MAAPVHVASVSEVLSAIMPPGSVVDDFVTFLPGVY
jgi:hypothetical protein